MATNRLTEAFRSSSASDAVVDAEADPGASAGAATAALQDWAKCSVQHQGERRNGSPVRCDLRRVRMAFRLDHGVRDRRARKGAGAQTPAEGTGPNTVRGAASRPFGTTALAAGWSPRPPSSRARA